MNLKKPNIPLFFIIKTTKKKGNCTNKNDYPNTIPPKLILLF